MTIPAPSGKRSLCEHRGIVGEVVAENLTKRLDDVTRDWLLQAKPDALCTFLNKLRAAVRGEKIDDMKDVQKVSWEIR